MKGIQTGVKSDHPIDNNLAEPFLQKDKEHNDFLYHSHNVTHDSEPKKYAFTTKEGLSIKGAALVFMSTIIGGGIVSLPYSYASVGVFIGIGVHLFTISLMLLSVYLCLKSKDHLGYE